MTSRYLISRASFRALLAASVMLSPQFLGYGACAAQTTTYPAVTDVDPVSALSRYLRMLASNPRDLTSLTGAGRAALAVGDPNAALGFYARAEEISPRNGRIKAGLATALVQMEQPRAALKLFDEAVALGVPLAEIAADRGLANDLLGDARRAQADYTVALRARDDDETVRRLALSMAVSGDRDGALAILSPLLRRRDGGAERARAFVLALTGDQAGAAGAVRAAMPGAQANAMLGFMNRLTGLNPAQKALAVNFGYFPSDGRTYTAAELFADARAAPLPSPGSMLGARDPRRGSADTPLIPAGEALGPRLAANETSAAPRRRPGQEEVLPPAHVLSAPIPGVTPPAATRRNARPGAAAAQAFASDAAETRSDASSLSTAPGSAAPLAGATAAVAQAPAAAARTDAERASPSQPASPAPVATSSPRSVAARSTPSAKPSQTRIATVAVPGAERREPVVEPVQPLSSPPTRSHSSRAQAGSAGPEEASPAPARSVRRTAKAADPANGTKQTTVAARDRTDTAETDGEASGQTARKGGKGVKLAAVDPKAKKPLSASEKDDDRRTSGDGSTKGGRTKGGKADTGGKAGTGGKADTKGRTTGKTTAKTSTKEEAKSAARPETAERYWVQVASGANKANLDKAWATVRDKAPKQLSGQSIYTAPWRASNRLLIGPFKTADEAQAKVNALARSGVSGIQFTTRAGAEVEKVAKK